MAGSIVTVPTVTEGSPLRPFAICTGTSQYISVRESPVLLRRMNSKP